MQQSLRFSDVDEARNFVSLLPPARVLSDRARPLDCLSIPLSTKHVGCALLRWDVEGPTWILCLVSIFCIFKTKQMLSSVLPNLKDTGSAIQQSVKKQLQILHRSYRGSFGESFKSCNKSVCRIDAVLQSSSLPFLLQNSNCTFRTKIGFIFSILLRKLNSLATLLRRKATAVATFHNGTRSNCTFWNYNSYSLHATSLCSLPVPK